ncbi:MAG: hypothetical protein ACRDTH_29850 [Pseudonocardiaceae bacterium]
MSDPSPSTRFRGVAIAVGLAGAMLAPALGLTRGALGLPMLDGPGGSRPGQTAINPELLGASGVLARDESLDLAVIAALDRPVRVTEADPPPAGPLQIPPIVLDSYRRAETVLAAQITGCGLRWSLLAGLGQVISEHAKGGDPDQSGVTRNPILGPRLDGSPGLAEIPDTDDGRLDGDTEWDRAAGPMQIIPQVWQRRAADSDVSGTADPHNVYDASLVAGRYLCENDSELRSVQGQATAVFRYKRSEAFVLAAILWARAYESRAEPDPPVVAAEAELPVLPAPETIALPKQPPPGGPLPRGPVQSPVPPLPPPARPTSGDGSALGRSRSDPAQPPSTGAPTTTNPAPTTTNPTPTTTTRPPSTTTSSAPTTITNPTPTTTNPTPSSEG